MSSANSHTTDAPLLTTSDAAARLSVSTDQIVALIRSRRLVAVDISIGGKKPRWRIAPESLQAFLSASTPAPTPARLPRRKRTREAVTEFF